MKKNYYFCMVDLDHIKEGTIDLEKAKLTLEQFKKLSFKKRKKSH